MSADGPIHTILRVGRGANWNQLQARSVDIQQTAQDNLVWGAPASTSKKHIDIINMALTNGRRVILWFLLPAQTSNTRDPLHDATFPSHSHLTAFTYLTHPITEFNQDQSTILRENNWIKQHAEYKWKIEFTTLHDITGRQTLTYHQLKQAHGQPIADQRNLPFGICGRNLEMILNNLHHTLIDRLLAIDEKSDFVPFPPPRTRALYSWQNDIPIYMY